MYARRRRRERKKWPQVLVVIALVSALLGTGLYLASRSITFELCLLGQEEILLSYGDSFSPGSVSAVVKGPLMYSREVQTEITVNNPVREDMLGEYTVTYSGKYLWLEAQVCQKVTVKDTRQPVITLVPDPDSITPPGEEYQEPGFSAWDDCDGDITHLVQIQRQEDVITYTVSDSSGNTATVSRHIRVEDVTAPELTLNGEGEVTIIVGTEYAEPGYAAQDTVDGDLTGTVQIQGSVDIQFPGEYTLVYTVTDAAGNTTQAERKVTVVPAEQPEPPGPPEIVVPSGKVIYLTFDDGPSKHTPQLLEVLKKYDVKATFFVVDDYYSYLLSDIAADGHAIGVHSSSHHYEQIYSSEEAFFQDFNAVYDTIVKYTGIHTTLMRFPGGSSNRISEFNPGIMTRLTALVQEKGYQYFDWNVDSKDAGGAKTAEQVFQNVVSGIGSRQSAVVLQHDIHDYSVDAVERIIQWGLANGYTFLPLEPTSPPCKHTVRN